MADNPAGTEEDSFEKMESPSGLREEHLVETSPSQTTP